MLQMAGSSPVSTFSMSAACFLHCKSLDGLPLIHMVHISHKNQSSVPNVFLLDCFPQISIYLPLSEESRSH